MLNPIDWVSVMLGPDCWNYSPQELGFSDSPDERYGSFDSLGLRYGVDPTSIDHPVAQSLLYAVSGVGVHLLFISLCMIYLAFGLRPRDRRPPLAMLMLDILTVLNATGSLDKHTAGHPRCFDDNVTFLECAAGLRTFAPVAVLDLVWFLVVIIFPGKDEQNERKSKVA